MYINIHFELVIAYKSESSNKRIYGIFKRIKFVYMAHHFILLRLNPFDLRVDWEGWWFEHSVS